MTRVLKFLKRQIQSLQSVLPEPRRWHLVLLPFVGVLAVVLFNAGLVALVWNRFGLHRACRAKPLSVRGCMIAGAILLCFGV